MSNMIFLPEWHIEHFPDVELPSGTNLLFCSTSEIRHQIRPDKMRSRRSRWALRCPPASTRQVRTYPGLSGSKRRHQECIDPEKIVFKKVKKYKSAILKSELCWYYIEIRSNSVWQTNQELVRIHNVAAHEELFKIYNWLTSRKVFFFFFFFFLFWSS